MGMAAQVEVAVARLFGPLAAEAGRESGVIVRQRTFTAVSLARTFVLGFLHKPDASDEELARIAVQSGAAVTPQAIDQRHTPKLVAFLEGLFRRAVPMAWCDGAILVTSVPADRLTPEEAIVLCRARWQIESVFKRWKSRNRVAEVRGSTTVRQMVRVWSRLLAAGVQHWLVVASAWGDPTRSRDTVAEAVRSFVGRLLTSLEGTSSRAGVIADLIRVIATTCRRNRRTKPGTVELLNDVGRLDFELT